MSATRTSGTGVAERADRGRKARSARRTSARTQPPKPPVARRGVSRAQRSLPHRPPRHRLLLVCVGIVGLSLLVVLFINAALSAGAFRQHDLELQLIRISESEEALARAVQIDEAPMTIEKRARALGMVPAGSPVFLDLGKGKVLGEPVPAPSPSTSVSFDDELLAPPERLNGTQLITEAPAAPQATATVTVTAPPPSAAGAESPAATPTPTAAGSASPGAVSPTASSAGSAAGSPSIPRD